MLKRLIKWFFKLVLLSILLNVAAVVALRWFNPSFTALMVERHIQHYMEDQPYAVSQQWLSYEQLPNALKMAVIAAEDQHFATHNGFDLDAIQAAFERNQESNKTKFGASTISQQLAKNQFLWSSRSYVRKGFEAWFTLLLEQSLSKERILEIYLNSVEWGNGIYGAQAAAQHHFGINADALSQRQANLLAAILPNPLKYRVNNPSPYIQKRAAWINQQVVQLGGANYLRQLKAK